MRFSARRVAEICAACLCVGGLVAITSTVRGASASQPTDEGAPASTADAIVRLISDARVVRFAVPEQQGAALRLGAKVSVECAELGEFAGVIVAIAPEIQVGTRLIFAEAKLERVADLRVGTVGQVRFAGR